LEPTPDQFVAKLVEVFREVRRVLRDDGTLWLNLGDSYSRSPAKGGSGPGGKNEGRWGYGDAQSARIGSSDGAVGRADRPGNRSGGLGEKQLLGIPWRVAFALQADGWYLRQDIIWHKPNPMPESVRDRCTKAHEYIFLLSKSPKYYFDHKAMQEPCVKGAAGSEVHTGKTGEHQLGRASTNPRKQDSTNASAVPGATEHSGIHRERSPREPETRNRRDVWTVTTQPFAGAHFATFPPALVEPCILAGCPVGGAVLDCFGGSGTVGMVAASHGREFILCELNPEYADMARNRISGTQVQAQFQERAP
jgi:DNA modification methylase